MGNDPYPPPGGEIPSPTAPHPTPQPKPKPTPTYYPSPTDPPLSPQAKTALQYIVDREGVFVSDLIVSNELPIEYPTINKQYMAIKIYNRVDFKTYRLFVDLDDNSVIDDVTAIERAEAEARYEKYGKLDPVLYERLQTAGENEELTIAVWVSGERGRSRAELFAILTERYPEAREALERHASPFDVEDRALSEKMKDEYNRMHQEDLAARVQPLVQFFQDQNIDVQTYKTTPTVVVTVGKDVIQTLTERDDVQIIYLVEGEGQPELDTATRTDRVNNGWTDLGLDNEEPVIPITIGIVDFYNVDWDNSFLHHAPNQLNSCTISKIIQSTLIFGSGLFGLGV